MEPSFAAAEAQSEPATTSNSGAGTATASIEPSQALNAPNVVAAPYEKVVAADAAAHAAASASDESAPPNPICEAVKAAAEENDIPIGFFARLLWQESRFRAREVSSAGARGIAQFMPQTAVEMGLRDPFDPLQAIPVAARFLRKLHDQFGNLGLAAAAYNAGGGRIEKWLSRRSTLPKETRAYVKIITGHMAEAWTDEESTVHMPTDLPQKAPCEGVGGLSRQDQIAAVNVDLTPSASAMLRKAEADDAEDKKNVAVRKLRVAAVSVARHAGAAFRKTKARAVLLAAKGLTRKRGKQAAVRFASASSSAGRTKSSRAREL
ncbi:lytic transglycosylase domain-containing protein [Bradyrhizobium sp. 200]|nr:lytic transglycosylase domain-containing protein [Bradyrhizobium sp. 200]